MNKEEKENVDLLSEIVIYNKYAKYIPELKRRETWNEIVQRYLDMLHNKFPDLNKEIYEKGQLILNKKVLPSMRAMQFAGKAIEKNEARIYNCAYLPIDDVDAFSEVMFLLLGGTGVGYSVQFKHVEKLPEIKKPTKAQKYLIQDSIIGWADAVKHLMKSYFGLRNTKPKFDFSDIRPLGSRLKTAGGKAPGPEPLQRCLFEIERILESKNNGDKLNTLEVHDIICHLADSVLAGGIRRAALLSLFSVDDELMLGCKFGNWWELNPQRGRANNSAVLLRHKITKSVFMDLWKKIELSGSGEPGFGFTNNSDWGTNPCVTGDTEILTKEGYRTIESLVNKEVDIWNGFEWSNVTPKITGYNQHLLKVTLSDGRELICTDYHNWILAEGYTGKNKKVETKDLKIGDKIIKYNFPIIKEGESTTLKHAYTQGFISAEGMDDYNHFWLYEPKYMCKDRLDIRIESNEYKNINNIGRKSIHYNDIYESKDFVPFNWSLTYKIEWLSGLFDGDGTELIEGGLQLSSTNLNFLKDLQKLVSTLGINSKICYGNEEGMRLMPDGKGSFKEYFCNTSYRICIGSVQIQDLKKLGLKCNRLKFDKTPQRDASQFVKIVKIEDAGYANEVYCFNEPIKHYGVFNGILTGQCFEIALRPFQMCNLCEINVSNIESQEDLNNRVITASFFGTLQASYTDFHYLRPIWKKTCEKDALLGLGMTGIASMEVFKYNLEEASNCAKLVNKDLAKKININSAARITCIKPSGTTSCVLGTSSGIHAWHDKFYIRRMQVSKNEDIYKYLIKEHPHLVKDHLLISNSAVIELPIKAPDNAVIRTESALDLLERVKKVSQQWIKPGHVSGDNTHNVSATISIDKNRTYVKASFINYKEKPIELDEWQAVGEWMWENKEFYNGLSVLPYDGGTYSQAPFETITEEEYNKLASQIKPIKLSDIIEEDDNTDLKGELACSGDNCVIK